MGMLNSAIVIVLVAIAINKLPNLFQKGPIIPTPQGYVKPGWELVQQAFKDSFEQLGEKGCAFAVYHKGELVVNLWGGFANEQVEYPWKESTTNKIYSSSKGIGAIVMALLVDRGHLDYKEKVSTYWPEFAVNGKENITVEQLLSHQAGLHVFDETYSEIDALDNWPKIRMMMANQKPHWTPGDGHGYHATTIGLYMDQLVRLTDPKHRPIDQFFKEEIADPFGIDFSFGLEPSEHHRCAWSTYTMERTSLSDIIKKRELIYGMVLSPEMQKIGRNPMENSKIELQNNPDLRRVTNPSNAGYGTARGIAKLFGILSNGGIYNGKKLFKNEKNIEKLKEILTNGSDRVMMINSSLGRATLPLPTPMGGQMFGTPGAGGQMCYADTDNQLGWAFITNYINIFYINDHPTYAFLQNAMYDTIKKLR